MSTPEFIYLIPGKYDGERGMIWSDDPDPDSYSDPNEVVKYLRFDVHNSIIALQAKYAKTGMDAAKKSAICLEANAKRLLAESNPAALESERAMNAELTEEVEQLRARLTKHEQAVSVPDGLLNHIVSMIDLHEKRGVVLAVHMQELAEHIGYEPKQEGE